MSSEEKAERKRRNQAKEERIEDLVGLLEEIAFGEKPAQPIQVMAANSALDRLAGKPQQTNTNLNLSAFDLLTIEQQRALLAAIDAIPGNESGDPAGPPPPDSGG